MDKGGQFRSHSWTRVIVRRSDQDFVAFLRQGQSPPGQRWTILVTFLDKGNCLPRQPKFGRTP